MRRIISIAASLALISALASSGCKMLSRSLDKSGTVFTVEVVKDESDAPTLSDRSR